MFERMERQLQARHLAHFPRPQARGIDHVFRPDVALVGNNLPTAVPLRFQGFHPGVAIDGGALLFRRLRVAMCNPVGIDMTLVCHVDAAFQVRTSMIGQSLCISAGLMSSDSIPMNLCRAASFFRKSHQASVAARLMPPVRCMPTGSPVILSIS